MPHKCAVATCRGNYKNGPKVAVFKFPNETELRMKWIRSLRRKDGFQPTKHTRVCGLHFQADEIIREIEMYDEKSARLIKAPISRPRLKKGCIPSQFPDGPSYMSSNSVSRMSPEKKKARLEEKYLEKAIEESLKTKELYDDERSFESSTKFNNCLAHQILETFWMTVHTENSTMLLDILSDPAPEIQKSVVINEDLIVYVYIKNIAIKSVGKFVFPLKISTINMFLEVLKEVESLSHNFQNEEYIMNSTQIVDDVLSELKRVLPEKETELNFLSEQVNKLNVNKQIYRYTPDLLIFCSLLNSISPHAYKFLRHSGYIAIPHPHTIRRICSTFSLNPITEQFNDDFLGYVKQKYKDLEENDKTVIIMMDEVHLNSCFDFKGGNLCGMAYNCEKAATSAYVFMIRSLLSPFKDVAHILPVKSLNAEDLYQYLKKIIIGLENIGYRIVAVVSDNNSINKKAMSLFCMPPKISIVYKNPADLSRPLFFVIDSVHILKCVRNNWINQKNSGQCLFYPNFENFSKVETAAFACIKNLHSLEAGRLIKYSYGLTLKALYPTNLERQNVKLALQIFDSRLVEAIIDIGKENSILNYKTTAEFIKIISTWWSIVNVKSIFKGHHKMNEYQKPLTVQNDDVRYVYLNKLLEWLDHWKLLGCSSGGLTKETHFALTHTSYSLLEMARYCIEELKFTYFLPGKVQTDLLENRFGKYRQLAGSQHNISIRQVYETEAKLRLQSLLPTVIKSSKYGGIPINLNCKNLCIESLEQENIGCTFSGRITITNEDIQNVQNDIPILMYIAGYCSYKVVKTLSCDICKGNLTIDKELIVENEGQSWIKRFDRGLLYPHPDVLNSVIYNYIVIQKLVSEEFENEFLFSANQRDIACNLTLDILIENDLFLNLDGCPKDHEPQKVLKQILWSSTNTFLNNYCKLKNDTLHQKSIAKERKLKTLKHK